jgi:hypothetical protein
MDGDERKGTRVGGGKYRGSSIESRDDASLGDGDRLLLHRLVEDRSVTQERR